MKKLIRLSVATLALSASAWAPAQTLLNASYDVAREFYKDYNAAFIANYKKTTGKDVKIDQSHGGSSAQARAVNDGLDADVVTMNTTTDVNFLASTGIVAKDWAKRFPNNAAPTTSTMLFLTRNGNPKGIKDWDDLVKPGIQVIVVNPKTGPPGPTCARRAAPTRRPQSSLASCTRTCRCWPRAGAMRPPSSCNATSATCW